MPSESEILKEMLAAMSSDEARKKSQPEIEEFANREGLDGKSILQKFYSQWKSGKKGHLNLHNSWAAYYLGITDRKPEGGFFFKKRRAFARPSPPDIDCDFEYERRDEIIQYLVEKYGRGQVGNIGTYGALKMRSALTRIIKALDIAKAWRLDAGGKVDSASYTARNVEKVNEILGVFPKQHGSLLKVKDGNGEEQIIKNSKDAYKYVDDFRFYMDKYPEIMQHASNLEGLLSVFGCVAADTPIKTQKGWVRIDQLDKSCQIAYLNSAGEEKLTSKYVTVKTGTKQCYRMQLENGCFVDLTDEHVVFTDAGCVEFKKIRENPDKYKVLSVGV